MSLQKAKGPVPCSHLAALTAGACRCLHGLRSLFGASEVTRVFFLGILWKVALFRANLGVKLNMTDIKVVSHTVHSERNTEENAENNQKVGLRGCIPLPHGHSSKLCSCSGGRLCFAMFRPAKGNLKTQNHQQWHKE